MPTSQARAATGKVGADCIDAGEIVLSMWPPNAGDQVRVDDEAAQPTAGLHHLADTDTPPYRGGRYTWGWIGPSAMTFHTPSPTTTTRMRSAQTRSW